MTEEEKSLTKNEEREKFFLKLYEKVEDIEQPVNSIDIGKELELDERTSSNIVKYLEGEGLIEITGSMGQKHKIRITHKGIQKAERQEETSFSRLFKAS